MSINNLEGIESVLKESIASLSGDSTSGSLVYELTIDSLDVHIASRIMDSTATTTIEYVDLVIKNIKIEDKG